MTRYRVFRRIASSPSSDVPAGYELVGEYDGNDAKGAIKAAILAMPDAQRSAASTQTFAACAASSWQELSPTVKVETTVSFA